MSDDSAQNQHLERARAQYAAAELHNSVVAALADLLQSEIGADRGGRQVEEKRTMAIRCRCTWFGRF